MSEGRWRISVTAPDWGENHLALDAIVAFVDEELEPGPQARATRHVARCRECAAQVIAQTQARLALRTAAGPRLPSSLLSALRSIPEHTDLPAPPAGLAVSEDGELVCQVRPDPPPRKGRRARLATPSDRLDVDVQPASRPAATTPLDRKAAPAPVETAPAAGHSDHSRRPPVPRRIRFGTGVAVSGLALGALAFGATAAAPSTPAPSMEQRGVLGGTLLGGTVAGRPALPPSGLVDARLRLGGTQLGAAEPAFDGLGELGGLPGAASVRGLW